MRLDEYFLKLQRNKISLDEYISLKTQCLRLVRKACRRYKIDDISKNKVIKYDVFDDIYAQSILKSLKDYDKEKGSFSTYFFYKACSSARNEVGKLKRRIKINNTIPLDEGRT